MRKSRNIETKRDRKALARDAGMSRVSGLSVLAGVLCGFAAFEILTLIAGAVTVGIHGSTDFSNWGSGQFKLVTAIILAAAVFVAFMLGGYVSGRMSRRRGATHGLVVGVVGVALAAVAAMTVTATGADNGVASVARHIHVAATWHQWRFFGFVGAIVVAGAMVLGGLVGGIEGDRWHGMLLARAVDPTYGPEAEERAKARKRMAEAESAHLAAANHVGRLTAVTRTSPSNDGVVEEPVPATASVPTRDVPATTAASAAAPSARATDDDGAVLTADRSPLTTTDGDAETTSGPRHLRRHHLLSRN